MFLNEYMVLNKIEYYKMSVLLNKIYLYFYRGGFFREFYFLYLMEIFGFLGSVEKLYDLVLNVSIGKNVLLISLLRIYFILRILFLKSISKKLLYYFSNLYYLIKEKIRYKDIKTFGYDLVGV